MMANKENYAKLVQIQKLPTGLKFGKKLGAGEFGSVYEVNWKGETVAIKKVIKSHLYDPDEMWKEIYINNQLSADKQCTKHVSCYLEMAEDPKNYYILLDLLNGKNLYDTMDVLFFHHLKNPVKRTAVLNIFKHIFIKLLESLTWVHKKGVVHNDIHGGNVFVDIPKNYSITKTKLYVPDPSKVKVKIIDFGDSCATKKFLCYKSASGYKDSYDHYPYEPSLIDGNFEQWKAYDNYYIGMVIYEYITGIYPEPLLYAYMRPRFLAACRGKKQANGGMDDAKFMKVAKFQFNLKGSNYNKRANVEKACLKKLQWFNPFNQENFKPSAWINWKDTAKVHVYDWMSSDAIIQSYTPAQQKTLKSIMLATMMLMHPNWRRRTTSKLALDVLKQ